MSRLVIVSNRSPAPSAKDRSGGLVVALDAALRETGGLWFGWSGEIAPTPASRPTLVDGDGFSLATIALSPEEYEGYYGECANRALWPLFHGRLDLGSFDREPYAVYRRVNRRFAEGLASLLAGDDTVWVHDYHLFPLGAELRRLGVAAPIGFFLHIPFPAPEVLAALPWHRTLLEELSAYDLVGFQTASCLRNYYDALSRLAGPDGRAVPSGQAFVARAGRSRAGSYPIGIDTRGFAARAAAPAARRIARRLNADRQDRIWLAGVERLDYTKGLAKRFLALETLLDRSPEFRDRVCLVQIAAPCRESVAEYRDLRTSLEGLSGRINARFGTFDWTPIRHMNRAFDHDQLAALYRVSRVGLVTPLRDGMNLVAKEYVAAQDPGDPGVLILSRFAGAAEELTDALLVNPYDPVAVAQAMACAVEMPLSERQARWERMMAHLMRHDVRRWRRRFLSDLATPKGPLYGKGAVAA